jgi:hypothetical protein
MTLFIWRPYLCIFISSVPNPRVKRLPGLSVQVTYWSLWKFTFVDNSKKNDSVEITNKMQPCNRIYYSTVRWRLNMLRGEYRSSSGALTVFAASGLHTHVVTGRSQVWVGTASSLKAQHVSSGIPLIIRSSNCICSLWFTYACGDRS